MVRHNYSVRVLCFRGLRPTCVALPFLFKLQLYIFLVVYNIDLQRDWAELKKELQEQRDHVRVMVLDKKNALDSCMKQVEDMRKELQSSWKAASDAESRAAITEVC